MLKTSIGKYFFRLLNKHFPPVHKLYKIINKNILKFSYSWMPNLKAKIDGHTWKHTASKNKIMQLFEKRRKLPNERSLPHWKCFILSCDDEKCKPKLYKGICETIFKKHYANHKKSFNTEKSKNNTKLSTKQWKLEYKRHATP